MGKQWSGHSYWVGLGRSSPPLSPGIQLALQVHRAGPRAQGPNSPEVPSCPRIRPGQASAVQTKKRRQCSAGLLVAALEPATHPGNPTELSQTPQGPKTDWCVGPCFGKGHSGGCGSCAARRHDGRLGTVLPETCLPFRIQEQAPSVVTELWALSTESTRGPQGWRPGLWQPLRLLFEVLPPRQRRSPGDTKQTIQIGLLKRYSDWLSREIFSIMFTCPGHRLRNKGLIPEKQ